MQVTADFSTNVFTVSHAAEFQFVGTRDKAKAAVSARADPVYAAGGAQI
jgi:hypothetical protein